MKMPNIAVLPALVTLGNAVSGFAAICLLLKAPPFVLQDGIPVGNLDPYVIAGYLIFLAMVFDALDGRIARFARATSDFGGQLDSLCDAMSFGAAPALLAYRLVVDTIDHPMFHRLALVLGAVYFGCTLLRLARFNVENVHDEEAHLAFRGLPSPAAAGALVSLTILVLSFWQDGDSSISPIIVWALPVMMLVLGLLMVSTIRYLHLLNQFIRGRRPLSYLVQIIFCVALLFILKEKALPLVFLAYAASGPVVNTRNVGGPTATWVT